MVIWKMFIFILAIWYSILAKVDTMEILKPILYNRHVYIVYTVVYIIVISYFGIFNTHDIQIV